MARARFPITLNALGNGDEVTPVDTGYNTVIAAASGDPAAIQTCMTSVMSTRYDSETGETLYENSINPWCPWIKAYHAADANIFFQIARDELVAWSVAYQGGNDDVVIYGGYFPQRDVIYNALRTISDAAGLPGFDWRPYQIKAVQRMYMERVEGVGGLYGAIIGRHNIASVWQTFEFFPRFVYYPVAIACEETGHAGLCAAAPNLAPGSEFWNSTINTGADIREAKRKSQIKYLVTIAVAFLGAAALAGAVGGAAAAASGTTAAGAGAEGALAAELTAEQWAAGLTAEQIAGTAALPSLTGSVVAPWIEAELTAEQWAAGLTAEQIAGTAALPEMLAAELTAEQWAAGLTAEQIAGTAALPSLAAVGDVTEEILSSLPAEDVSLIENVMQEMGVDTLMKDAGNAVIQQLTTMGKAALGSQLQSMFSGSSPSPAEGAFAASGFYEGEGALPGTPPSGKLKGAALPVMLGAGAGLLGLFLFTGRDD